MGILRAVSEQYSHGNFYEFYNINGFARKFFPCIGDISLCVDYIWKGTNMVKSAGDRGLLDLSKPTPGRPVLQLFPSADNSFPASHEE